MAGNAHLVAVLGLWALLVMTPGPDTLAVASTAIRSTRRNGIIAALGCGVATAIWAGGSMLGLGLLFAGARWLFVAIKLLGALYLIYFGGKLIVAAVRDRVSLNQERLPAAGGGLAAFRLGLLTDLSNPKAAVFFTSLFAVAVPPSAGLVLKAGTVSLVAVIAFGWYCLVAACLSVRPIAEAYGRLQRWIEGVAGALFVAFGVRLAAAKD